MADDVKDKLVNLEDLKAVTDDINDMTTGINLLRGTRDFTIGAESAGVRETDLKVDGWQSGVLSSCSFSKDEEGFGVMYFPTITTSGIFKASLIPNEVISGKKVTVSFDVKLHQQPTESKNLFQILGNTQTNEGSALHISYVNLHDNVDGYTYSNFPIDTWVKVVKTLDIPKYTSNYYVRTSIYFAGNYVPFSIRKVKVELGEINNPIWSPSPFDSATDGTVGINLLRGTRDFVIGKTNPPEIPSSSYYLDGYSNSSYLIKDVDREGFSTVTIPHYTSDRYVYAPVIPASPGDVFTAFFEAKFSNPEAYTNTTSTCSIRTTAFGTTGTINSINVIRTADGLHINELEPDTWYKFRYGYTVPEFEGNAYFAVLPIVPKNIESDMTVRKMGVYRGQVVDPIWSPSPFDLAQVDEVITEDSGVYILGDVPYIASTSNKLDLNEYIEPGVWSFSDSTAKAFVNAPSGMETSGRLYVEYSVRKSDGVIRQRIITHGADTEYLRNYHPNNGWLEWHKTYANTTVRPIEAGGTGATTALEAITALGGESIASQGVIIPNSSDLDNYLDPGTYYVGNSDAAKTMTNVPKSSSGFKLIVKKGYSNNSRSQTAVYDDANGQQMFIRTYNSSTWSSWVERYYKGITSIAGGGTGASDALAARNNLFANVTENDGDTTDDTWFLNWMSSTSNRVVLRKGAHVWNWIRKKIESNLVTTDDIDKMFEGTYEPAADAKLVDDEAVAYAIDRIKEL